MLSLYKLEIFNTVAMEGSFSRAAERLLLTQPAVSQHIRDLETALGTSLMLRGNRGVSLTPAGEILLDYTRCILRMLAEAESAVRGLDQLASGQMTIGATPGAGVYLLPDWVRLFHQRFAGLSISLRTDITPHLAQDVLARRVDLAFVEGELVVEPPLHSLDLRSIDLLLLVGAGHAWWGRSEVGVDELDGAPFVSRPAGSQTRIWIDSVLGRAQVTPHQVAEFDHPEAIKQAVAAGLGVAILPDWTLNPAEAGGRLRALPIRGVDLRRTLKLLWTEEMPLKPAARAFLAHLAEEFPQLAQIAGSEATLRLSLPGREAYRASRAACEARDKKEN